MNQLTIIINWSDKNNVKSTDQNKIIYSYLDLKSERISTLKSGNNNICRNNSSKRIVAMVGYISNLEQLRTKYNTDKQEDVELLDLLCDKPDIKLSKELEGSYTIFIWDEKNQKGYCFQDEFGSGLPLYYFNNKTELIISTSLKEVLKRHTIDRKLCKKAVKDFLITKTIVPNKRTFIEDVYKLVPGRCLAINRKSRHFSQNKINYRHKKYELDVAKDNMIPTLEKNINILYDQLETKNCNCTLSAGYDSNIILHYLSKRSEKIDTFTIGGRNMNEIENASLIGKQYKNLNHITKVVSSDRINSFPDIVWRTEGACCERGLFLQYELAGLLHKHGVSEIFAGEGADQILNQYRKKTSLRYLKNDLKSYIKYVLLKKIWPENFRESKFFKYIRRPALRINYDTELEYIYKKNGLILNSFNIQGLYPFISRNLMDVCGTLGELNNRKLFFIEKVTPILGKEKIDLISKAGGSTDIEYLLNHHDDLIKSLLDDDFFRPFVKRWVINRIKNDMMKYSELTLRLLYVYTFQKLFLSGNFDSMLDQTGIDIEFDQFVLK